MRYSGKNIWLLTGLGIIAVVAAHLLPHAVRGSGLWTFSAIGFGVLMALGCILFGLSAFAMDDIQRQSQRSDWYWGSVVGLCLLCGLVFPFVLFGGGLKFIVALLLMHETPGGYFFSGVMVTLGLFALGWLLAWLFRRLHWMK
jgi:bacteriorhodopsin